MRLRCPRLARFLGLMLLVGLSACGSPAPDPPVLGHSTGSADAVVAPPAGGATCAGLAAQEPARQAPTQKSPLGPPAQPASTSDARITDASQAGSPAHVSRLQTAASSADTPQSDERADAEGVQREARQLWFEEARENPDVTVRLQALELWAEQRGDDIDPLTYALVDEDEQVRTRAEELWEQQLTKEATATRPVQEEGPRGPAEW